MAAPCQVLESDPQGVYGEEESFTDLFYETRAIKFMHNVALRYGHPSNLTALLDESSSDNTGKSGDYIRGLMATSVTLSCFFLLWMALLLIFKCVLGPRVVGFLSGRRLPVPPKPNPKHYNIVVQQEDGEEPPVSSSLTTVQHQNKKEEGKDEGNEEEKRQPQEQPLPGVTKNKQEYDYDIDRWRFHTFGRVKRADTCYKIVIIFATLSIVIAAMLLSFKGVMTIGESVEDGITAIDFAQSHLLANGIRLVQTIIEQQQIAQDNLDMLIDSVNNGICPAIRTPICTNTSIIESCTVDQIFYGERILNFFEQFASSSSSGREQILISKLGKTKQDLEDLNDFADDTQELVEDSLQWSIRISMIFSLLLATVALSFMISLIMTHTNNTSKNLTLRVHEQETTTMTTPMTTPSKVNSMDAVATDGTKNNDDTPGTTPPATPKKSHPDAKIPTTRTKMTTTAKQGNFWITKCCCIPLFIILVDICWISSMAVVIGSITLSNFCIESPDTKFLTILNNVAYNMNDEDIVNKNNKESLSPLVYEFATYYIQGCPRDDIPQQLIEKVDFLRDVISRIAELQETFDDDLDWMVCRIDNGNNDGNEGSSSSSSSSVEFGIINGLATTTISSICSLSTILMDLLSLLRCENWFPLYETIVFDAMCYNGTTGLTYITLAQTIIVFMSMIVMTFRVAFYEIEIEETETATATATATEE